MGAPQQPYPSFTLVLTKDSYPFRLPAYRVSHLGRYHPYPRSSSLRFLNSEEPQTVSRHNISRTYLWSKYLSMWQSADGTPYSGPRLDRHLVRSSLALTYIGLSDWCEIQLVMSENVAVTAANLHAAVSPKGQQARLGRISLSSVVLVSPD